MFWSLLHRMILWELVKVFVLSLIGITGILLMAGIIAEASQQGLGPTQILAAIPLIVPSTLPYTIPATTLFASTVVYGRLAHDSEILAIKAAGINILKVVWPCVLLGLVMSGVTMGMYYRVIPYTHRLLRTMVFTDAEGFLYGILSKDHQISHSRLPYAIFVERVQGKKLINPIFKRRGPKESYDLIASSREAVLQVDMTRRQILVHMSHGIFYSPGGDTGYFEERTWEVPLPDRFARERPEPRPRDRTWQEMLERREELLTVDRTIVMHLSQDNAVNLMKMPPTELPKHLHNLEEQRIFIAKELNAINSEMQMRPAISVGCLCFVLVGCPVGIWFGRSDYLSAFISCFLPIVFVYYPLLLCGLNLCKDGRVHPALSVWMANAVTGTVGLYLFGRLLKN